MDAAQILAAMLTLARPGESPYSQVVDEACGTSEARPSSGCPAGARYDRRRGGWVRQENEAEALARFRLIASSVDRVTAGAIAGEEPLWPHSREALARALVTIAFHESGFRRDVHEGTGPLGVGDCITVQGNRICRSFCLMQIRTGGAELARFGYKGRELVGSDAASTDRCLLAGVRAIAQVRGGGSGDEWFRQTIARYGGGSLGPKMAPWVNLRVATFRKVAEVVKGDGG